MNIECRKILDSNLYNESLYYPYPTHKCSPNFCDLELKYVLYKSDCGREWINKSLLYWIPGIKEHKEYETIIKYWDPNILSIILNRLENKADIIKYKDLIVNWSRSKLHSLLKLIRWIKFEDFLNLQNIIINWNLENIKILVEKWMTLEQIKQCEPIIVWLRTEFLKKYQYKDIVFFW